MRRLASLVVVGMLVGVGCPSNPPLPFQEETLPSAPSDDSSTPPAPQDEQEPPPTTSDDTSPPDQDSTDEPPTEPPTGPPTEPAPDEPLPDDSDTEPTLDTGSIAGRLFVQADTATRPVLEQEPNDSLEQAQYIASVEAGDQLSIFGDASATRGDIFDAFAFVANEPVWIELTLTFTDNGMGRPEDLDVSLHDFTNFQCAPGDVGDADFAYCYDGTDNPETGAFQIEGSFILVVSAFSGSASYQLDIAVSAADTEITKTVKLQRQITNEIQTKGDPPLPANRQFASVSNLVPDELVVAFEKGISISEQERILDSFGMHTIERSPSGLLRVACRSSEAKDLRRRRIKTLGEMTALRSQPGLRLVASNERRYIARTPNDEYFNLQWHYPAINLPDAWDITTGSNDVIVAVIDTGILSGHPDVQGRFIDGYDFIEDPLSARDGNGRDPDPEDPGDLFGGPGQSSFHGTHVAGTIGAATNNTTGVAGVTWQTRIMPLRAVGVDGGTTFDVSEAIRYAAGLPNISGTIPQEPARVINLSIAGSAGEGISDVEEEAISDAINAGAIVVAAAGNEGSSLPAYPAALPDVISVSAVDIQLELADYSNYGSSIDLAAPGGYNGTDLNGDTFGDGVLSTGGSDPRGIISFEYIFGNGTSMAAPHVTGVAALIIAANPALTGTEVRQILESTARDLGVPGRDYQFGYGLIDAAAAVREALNRAGTPTASDPILSLSTTSLDFGNDRVQFRVQVSNTGGGFLTITSVVPEELDGDGWLGAQISGSTTDANTDAIIVTVDRTGQPEGTYRGTVTINAEGLTPAAIDVTMTVGEQESFNESIFILAVEPGSLDTVAEDETSALEDFTYELTDLAPGEYVIYAGTDRDNNGIICEIGDLCGALPSVLQPEILTIEPGQQLSDMDFGVAQILLQQTTSKTNSPPSLKRLR